MKFPHLLKVVANPLKWPALARQVWFLIKNILLNRTFSLNPNSKTYWDKKFKSMSNFWRVENYTHIVDLLPTGVAFSLLDVGCALGDGCLYLKENFPLAKITGIDISEVAVSKARKKSNDIAYRCVNVLKQEIPDRFDYVLIIETLEHFDDPFIVVDRCLKATDRALIVSVPYSPDKNGRVYHASEHRFHFNERTFTTYENAAVIKITDYVKTTKGRCIIYEIRPEGKTRQTGYDKS